MTCENLLWRLPPQSRESCTNERKPAVGLKASNSNDLSFVSLVGSQIVKLVRCDFWSRTSSMCSRLDGRKSICNSFRFWAMWRMEFSNVDSLSRGTSIVNLIRNLVRLANVDNFVGSQSDMRHWHGKLRSSRDAAPEWMLNRSFKQSSHSVGSQVM